MPGPYGAFVYGLGTHGAVGGHGPGTRRPFGALVYGLGTHGAARAASRV